MNDIIFNFVFTPHGIFEGRGWDVQTEETGSDFNYYSFGFITDFMTEQLQDRAYCVMGDGYILGKLRDPFDATCEDDICPWQTVQISNNSNCSLIVSALNAMRT